MLTLLLRRTPKATWYREPPGLALWLLRLLFG